MAQIKPFTIDPENAQDEFSPLVGKHNVIWTDSEMVATKAGTGFYLKAQGQVIDGPRSGAVFFHMLNLINPNEVAVKIATQHLTQVAIATGVEGELTDTNVLHNKPMMADFALRKDDPQYSEVKRYSKAGGASKPVAQAEPVAQAAPATQAEPVAQADDDTPPWMK